MTLPSNEDHVDLERDFLSQCITEETLDKNVAAEEIESIKIEEDILSHCVAAVKCGTKNINSTGNTSKSSYKEKFNAKKLIVTCNEKGHENTITLYYGSDKIVTTNDDKIISYHNRKKDSVTERDNSNSTEEWLDYREINVSGDLKKRFNCIQCDYKTKKMGNLKDHMKSIHNKKDAKYYQCLKCDFKTLYRRNLNFHSRVHNRLEKFRCDICDKNFNRKNNLDSHILKHHPNNIHLVTSKMYTCNHCCFTSIRRNEIALHIMSNHSKKVAHLYTCEQCSFTSYYKSSMNRHSAIHSVKKPHVCKVCRKDFSQKVHLYGHILNHHMNDKELAGSISCKVHCCDYCEYRCVFAHTFKMHLKTHNID